MRSLQHSRYFELYPCRHLLLAHDRVDEMLGLVDGIQVHKVITASQSKSSTVHCMDLEHFIHWLHLELTHLVVRFVVV
jgi:hypothetical protein